MNRPRPPKKTETIEVRLPYAIKQAFMARTRARGRTASAVLREFVDAYLGDASEPLSATFKRCLKPVAATAVAASALAVYALTPSAVAAAPDLRAAFGELDRDHDGAVSEQEFLDPRETGVLLVRRGDGLTASREPTRLSSLPLSRGDPMPRIAWKDMSEMLRHAFAEHDTDRNGVITFGEFESHRLAMYRLAFEQLDSDRDGAIEASEYDEAVRRAPRLPAAPVHPLNADDDDNDGQISWNEFLAARQ